jgi:hypothetical protein
LILPKIDFKLKWFMFGYINAKVSWTKNLTVKINSRIRSSEATISSLSRINYGGRINYTFEKKIKQVRINSTRLKLILAVRELKPNIH